MREQAFLRPLLLMLAGLIIWALHFTVIYAANSLACTRGFANAIVLGAEIMPFVVGAATLVAVAALGLIALAARFGGRPRLPVPAGGQTGIFMHYVTLAVLGISLLGIIWDALPAYIMPPCA